MGYVNRREAGKWSPVGRVIGTPRIQSLKPQVSQASFKAELWDPSQRRVNAVLKRACSDAGLKGGLLAKIAVTE